MSKVKEHTKNIYKKHREEIMYVLVGFLTIGANILTYSICVEMFGFDITLSNAIAWFVAVIVAYITNKRYVFKSDDYRIKRVIKEASLFIGSRMLTGLLEIFCPELIYEAGITISIFGVEALGAKIIVSVAVIALNYFASKLIVFKKR